MYEKITLHLMSARVLDTNTLVVVLLTLAVLGVRSYTRYRHLLSITPPGPKPIPFLGNIFQVPAHESWKTYLDWSKKYDSDVISIRAFGQLNIVINSAKTAQELLAKRAANYSDKPSFPMLKLMDWEWNPAFMRYGDQWRSRRRLLHRALHENVVEQHFPAQSRYSSGMIQDFFSEPQRFAKHIYNYAARISLMTAYGLEDESYQEIAEKGIAMLSESVFVGAQLVNYFPLLIYLPEWFPGVKFHSFAREAREVTWKMRYDSITEVQKRIANGTAQPSLTLSLLNSSSELEIEAIVDVAGIIFAAASDTTAAAVTAGIKALVLHPQVQYRAQAEIDLIIGRGRLPVHSDRPSLPYIEAVCRELHRWYIVLPLGLPGASVHDDVYNGYFIPGGTTYYWNAWAISRDPEVYEDPDDFKPERWLDKDGQLTGAEEDTGFGYGRRACVGIHYGKASVWIAIASMLSVFRFSKSKDECGQDIEIPATQGDAMVSHPTPFQCDIQPRDDKALQLLNVLHHQEWI